MRTDSMPRGGSRILDGVCVGGGRGLGFWKRGAW